MYRRALAPLLSRDQWWANRALNLVKAFDDDGRLRTTDTAAVSDVFFGPAPVEAIHFVYQNGGAPSIKGTLALIHEQPAVPPTPPPRPGDAASFPVPSSTARVVPPPPVPTGGGGGGGGGGADGTLLLTYKMPTRALAIGLRISARTTLLALGELIAQREGAPRGATAELYTTSGLPLAASTADYERTHAAATRVRQATGGPAVIARARVRGVYARRRHVDLAARGWSRVRRALLEVAATGDLPHCSC